MMRSILRAGFLGFLALASLAADDAGALVAPKTVTMTGTFAWNRDTGLLTGVFTQGADNTWTVVFTANFRKKDSTYSGKLVGDPTAGPVTGTAATSNGKRTWRFTCTTANGELTGEHWETTKGEKRTGTFVLKPQQPS